MNHLFRYWLFIFFIFGILFRLWFINLVPQPFEFDQREYHQVALDLLGRREYMYISSYRLPGYPLFLGLIYKIFGTQDTIIWKAVQAGVDSMTAILVFSLAKIIFGSKKVAFISFLLYLFNPYTAGYVGVRLTEILSIFLVTLIFFLIIKFLFSKGLSFLLILALALGFLPYVRPGFLFFSIFIAFLLIREIIFSISQKRHKAITIFLFLLFFSSFFVGNTVRNYKYFNQATPLTVDNLFVREFYVSLFIENTDNIDFIPPQVNWIYQEFHTAKNAYEREKMAQKYIDLAIDEIKKDPSKFLVNRFKKSWYVWEKHGFFPYSNTRNSTLTPFIYWGNIAILMVSAMGVISAVRLFVSKKKQLPWWMLKLYLVLIIYISVLHAFTITSERFSLAAYPFIFLFAGFGFWILAKRVLKISPHQ